MRNGSWVAGTNHVLLLLLGSDSNSSNNAKLLLLFKKKSDVWNMSKERRLWPPTSISACPVGCNSFSAATRQQENSIKRVCTASVIPQMPHGTRGGMRWHDLRAENKSQRWDFPACSPVGSRGKGSLRLSQPPRAALSPDKEKDGLILLGYMHVECKAVKNKDVLSRVTGKLLSQGTQLLYSSSWQILCSAQGDKILAKTKQRQVSWVAELCARWRA